MKKNLVPGQRVLVYHLQDQEEGIVEIVNTKTGKVLEFFSQETCSHFDSCLIEQVSTINHSD